MKKFTNFLKTLWNDESGQGTAEYVLLVAIVVGIIIMFGPQLKTAMKDKIDKVVGDISGFQP